MVPSYRVEIRLLPGRCIDVVVEVDGKRRRVFEAVDAPSEALDVLREYLAGDEPCRVSLVLRAGERLLGAFATESGKLALYWAAAALEKTWRELVCEQLQRPNSVATESGPIRVHDAAGAAHTSTKGRVA
jgi:hypothetical protein